MLATFFHYYMMGRHVNLFHFLWNSIPLVCTHEFNFIIPPPHYYIQIYKTKYTKKISDYMYTCMKLVLLLLFLNMYQIKL